MGSGGGRGIHGLIKPPPHAQAGIEQAGQEGAPVCGAGLADPIGRQSDRPIHEHSGAERTTMKTLLFLQVGD